MRYGILGDIHSNLEALQAVVIACQEQNVKTFLCVGDIVGYGADPIRCIETIQELKADAVAGNHDWAVAGKFEPTDFNSMGQAAVMWTRDVLSNEQRHFLNNLPLIYKNEDLILVHGTLNKADQFIYLEDIGQALDTFYLMDNNVCFVGHTHVPQIFVKQDEKVYYAHSLQIETNYQNKYIINVGSVGQPRDLNPMAAYCIYDTETKIIEIKRIRYDVELAQRKILEAGLPEFLAYRLKVGQ